jgi:hypothetical protein
MKTAGVFETLRIQSVAMEEWHNDNYGEKIEKMVTLTVSAAKGLAPIGQVVLPMAQIANSPLAPPEARDLAKALSRILRGERDPIALVENLTPEFAELIWEALEQIETPLPEWDEADRSALTFEQLIEKVAEACTGEVMLWQRLWSFTEELATDSSLPPEVQALGQALRQILAGERQKYVLEALSAEHRWAVEQLLDWLVAQSAVPGQNPAQPSELDER